MIDLVCMLVQQRALLGAWGELEHLLHHVDGEDVAAVHAHDGLGDLLVGPEVISRDLNFFLQNTVSGAHIFKNQHPIIILVSNQKHLVIGKNHFQNTYISLDFE